MVFLIFISFPVISFFNNFDIFNLLALSINLLYLVGKLSPWQLYWMILSFVFNTTSRGDNKFFPTKPGKKSKSLETLTALFLNSKLIYNVDQTFPRLIHTYNRYHIKLSCAVKNAKLANNFGNIEFMPHN